MKAIIIDDEPDCVKLLALQLKMYCPFVQVIAECTQSNIAIEKINTLRPDIVFLDIEMPLMNGFQILDSVENTEFSLVFITAYDKFAVKAFKYNAIDYLLKPIDNKELIECVKKIESHKVYPKTQIENLKTQLHAPKKTLPDKIALPFQNGVTFVHISEIIYCEADNNYTKFYLSNGNYSIVSKTLRDIQEILEEKNFLRVHRQYLINLDHVSKYVKGEGNYLVMSNEMSIPVARNQKEKLIEKFGWI